MIDEREKLVLEALKRLGIEYERIEHPAAATMEECALIGKDTGASHFKNLFLTNKRGTEYYLVLIGADKRFKTSVISKLLKTPRLSFASEEQLYEVLSLKSGSISVTGLLHDSSRRVRVAIDEDLLKREKLLVHPNINTASLVIKTKDILRFIDELGFSRCTIEVKEREQDA